MANHRAKSNLRAKVQPPRQSQLPRKESHSALEFRIARDTLNRPRQAGALPFGARAACRRFPEGSLLPCMGTRRKRFHPPQPFGAGKPARSKRRQAARTPKAPTAPFRLRHPIFLRRSYAFGAQMSSGFSAQTLPSTADHLEIFKSCSVFGFTSSRPILAKPQNRPRKKGKVYLMFNTSQALGPQPQKPCF